jgi:predicted phosphoribosyltransferase
MHKHLIVEVFTVSAKFENLFDAGIELGSLLREQHSDLISDALIACVLPNGVPVALGIESVVGARELFGIQLMRTDESVVLDPDFLSSFDKSLVEGKRVILVDDGVETGTAAKMCGQWLTSLNVSELVLAVPVCPRTAMNQLQFLFTDIVSVQSPLGARSLAWHYTDFDVIDLQAAQALLDQRSKAMGA